MGIIAEILPAINPTIARMVERRKDKLARVAYEFGFTPAQRVARMHELIQSVEGIRKKHVNTLLLVVVNTDVAFALLRYSPTEPWRTYKWYAAPTVPAYRLRAVLDSAIGTA